MRWVLVITVAFLILASAPRTSTTTVTTTGSEVSASATTVGGPDNTTNQGDQAVVDHRKDTACITHVVEAGEDWTKIAAGKDYLTVLGLNNNVGWLDPNDLVCVAPAPKADEDANGAPFPPVTDSLPDDRCPEGATSPWPACVA